jgi:hypothetical protein
MRKMKRACCTGVLAFAALCCLSSVAGAQTAQPSLTNGPVDEQLNYSNINRISMYDIHAAKILHFSDRQVAQMYKLSLESGVPFREVIDRVDNGSTFAQLADEYGVSYASLQHVAHLEDVITQFESATATTGIGGAKSPSVQGPNSEPPGDTGVVLRPMQASNE